MLTDWLQGPFVYALYDAYGYTKDDNGLLFTAGFGSSALFGTFIGSLADQMGRRKFAALYCMLYILSCMTKHMNSFPFLIIGRVTGGIATSLLFSVFDAWMVSEHSRRDFDPELLGNTFTLAVLGNGVVAIIAGEVGEVAAEAHSLQRFCPDWSFHYGGYTAPFDIAILVSMLCLIFLVFLWSENFGHESGEDKVAELQPSLWESLAKSMTTIWTQPAVLYCGIVCSLFEASMFIFVFMWTPAVTEEGHPRPPYGHIFAAFMVMSMLGSQVFSLASHMASIQIIGLVTMLVSAVCMAVPVAIESATLRFLAFMVFELCIGVYFPMMGTLKAQYVPEESRTAIYNLFRLPLNLIVVATLVFRVDLVKAFIVSTLLLVVAALAQARLRALRSHDAPKNKAFAVLGVEDVVIGRAEEGDAAIEEEPKEEAAAVNHDGSTEDSNDVADFSQNTDEIAA